ncbi:hypothetical protein WA026_017741 [Henosepilachna vigintioctopunctata]|uniref:Uncharacterized protein n=1 Tax=Henosepilachna vigintioctopunctata TaxID=420089 RepID=A0AAW1U4D7_9CUCU
MLLDNHNSHLSIESGFSVTGISPFNENIFPESEFSGAFVTDRPLPHAQDDATSSAAGSVVVDSSNLHNNADIGSTVAVLSTSQANSSVTLPKVVKFLSNSGGGSANQYILPHIELHPCVTPPPESNESFRLSEEIKPIPKALLRLGSRRNIRKRKSTIYTWCSHEKQNLLQIKMKQIRRDAFWKMKKKLL